MRSKDDFMPPLAFFLLWPLGALIGAVRNYQRSWAKNIVWLFIAYFGFTFITPEGFDSIRYIDRFQEMGRYDWSFQTFISSLYSDETRYVDIVQPLLSYLLSRFTDDSRVLFMSFGLVLGYLYSRNVWFLLDHARPSLQPYSIIFIATFAVIVGFWQINGFRFWAAAHMYTFGLLSYLIYNKKSYLALSALSVLFHFTFMYPVLITVLYVLVGNRVHFYFALFVASFVVSGLELSNVEKYFNFLPNVFQEKSSAYLNYDAIETMKRVDGQSWHVRHHQDALRYALLVCMSVIYWFDVRRDKLNSELVPLFALSLLLYAVFNMTSSLPSGGRFLVLGDLLCTAFLFLYYQSGHITALKIKLLYVTLPLWLFYGLISIRKCFEFTGVYSIFGNPLIALWYSGGTTIINMIKN